MDAARWVVAALALSAPIALHLWLIGRSIYLRLHLWSWLGAGLAGAALALPAIFVERWLERWTEIDPAAGTGASAIQLVYAFLVAAPFEEALVVGAVAPFWHLRRVRLRSGLSQRLEILEGTAFAASGALGFTASKCATYLWLQGSGWLSVGRVALALPTHVLLSCLWGYMLGRNARRGIGGRRFSLAWLGAVVFSAVSDHLLFQRGPGGLFALGPLLMCMLLVALVLWRDVRGVGAATSGRAMSLLASAPAPSLAAIRAAFRQQDRPVTLRWISFGALVTTGMITTGIALAVFVGNKIGLDFSAVDRPDAGSESVGPLALLVAGVLVAFPFSGYLLARASGTHSVLEPAMSSALAMALVLVFMGMVAPLSVVFAIAFAPIAFGLSCAGAWVGIGS
ncbi:MAG: protease PrsW [Polyangiaceae bacterium]|nr:protease PrsW [Polyangiaceae bacterium]